MYALLQQALAESNKAGIATFVIRGREYLVALKAESAAQPTGVVDLMEALRASVEGARSPKDTGEKADASGKTGRGKKPAAKRRTRTSGARPLRSLTKAELYEKATKAGVKGRSSMTRDQLADALAKGS